MRYCKNCILPSTRPGLKIGSDGVCNACKTNSESLINEIDWGEREKEFIKAVNSVSSNSNWDCVLPVSGGKDSTWALLKVLEYGLKPLCVTWKTAKRNNLGEQNLQNLISLGADHIDFSVNPKAERAFTRDAFVRSGIPLIPMHLAIYNLPIRIATQFNIPLVVYGENSAIEYGGEKKYHTQELTKEWLLRFGVNDGTTAQDWISSEISEKDLLPYTTPDTSKFCPKAIFLSTFFQWSVFKTKEIAMQNGLQVPDIAKSGTHSFSDIDEEFLVTIHHWLKWYKFGFTRKWDNLSLEIRANKISRDKAIQYLVNNPEEVPINEIKDFCHYIEISENQFFEYSEKFRNRDIWMKSNLGKWIIKEPLHPKILN